MAIVLCFQLARKLAKEADAAPVPLPAAPPKDPACAPAAAPPGDAYGELTDSDVEYFQRLCPHPLSVALVRFPEAVPPRPPRRGPRRGPFRMMIWLWASSPGLPKAPRRCMKPSVL